MKIAIDAIRLKLTPALKVYIEEKFEPFSKLAGDFGKRAGAVPRIRMKDESELLIEVSRTSGHHRKGMVFRAEANMTIGGISLRAEADGEDIRTAIDLAKNELKRELMHAKGKAAARSRRVARKDLRDQ